MKKRIKRTSQFLLLSSLLPVLAVADPGPDHTHPSSESPLVDAEGQQLSQEQIRELVRERLALAVKLTAEGRRDEALEVYREVAESNPEQGIPALGRFLKLSGKDSMLSAFVERMQIDESIDSFIRARGLAAAGRDEEALEVLSSDQTILDGSNAGAAILLAKLYRNAGDDQKSENVLWTALTNASEEENKSLLFQALFTSPAPHVYESATSTAMAMDAGLGAADPTHNEYRDLINRIAIEFVYSPDYFERRDDYFSIVDQNGAGATLFGARLHIREENHQAALDFLDSAAPKFRDDKLARLIDEERAEFLQQIGRIEDSNVLRRKIAKQHGDKVDPTALFESTLIAIAADDVAGAEEILGNINRDKLNADERKLFWLARLSLDAQSKNLERLINDYGDASEFATNDDFEQFHQVIFPRLPDTEDHWEIEDRVRARFEKDSDTPPGLWRLAASAAREARKMPNEMEALYQYVQAKPNDSEALAALANLVTPIAAELAQADPEMLAAPEGEVERVNELAEKALKQLIFSRPYDPAPYAGLMQVMVARGKEKEGKEILINTAKDSENPRVVSTVAFVLATNGAPEDALPLYNRAIELAPENMQIKMNRASCYTRLERSDEAVEFYSELLKKGHQGRHYHIHELMDRIWQIYKSEEKMEEGVAYLMSVAHDVEGYWKAEVFETLGSMMLNEDRPNDADKFFAELRNIDDSIEVRGRTMERVAIAFYKKGEKDRTEEIYRNALKGELIEDHQIAFAQSRAEILRELGDVDECIQELRRVAREYSHDQGAMSSLYRAAQLSEEKGDKKLAAELYREFIQTDSLNFQQRREADERIDELKNQPLGN